MTKKTYLLVLQARASVELYIVEKELFDWVMLDDPGMPKGCKDECWEDTLTPESVKESVDDFDGVSIIRDEHQDSRANYIHENELETEYFETFMELLEYLKNNQIELSGEYHGFFAE